MQYATEPLQGLVKYSFSNTFLSFRTKSIRHGCPQRTVVTCEYVTMDICVLMKYFVADACSRYNARSDWLSAGALFSRITNYAKQIKM